MYNISNRKLQKTVKFKRPSYNTLTRSLLASGALFVGTPTLADITLVFGTYAADKPTTTVKKYKPFLDFLSRELTVKLDEPVNIKMKISKEYQDSISQLADGEVDFARFGPASYVTVKKKNPDIKIVAMESKKGKKRFNGVIAIHADSNIQSLSELSQSRFAFGDELSTIGRYLAQSHLIHAGIKAEALEAYEYLGRHDRVGSAVGAGQFTAGALKESTFNKMVSSGVKIKSLYTFDNVTKPWIASANLNEEVLVAMREVMLQTTNEDILKSINKGGFLPGTDTDYDLIRDAMKHSTEF